MTRPHALIVDDEPDIRELLEITLARMEVETTTAECLTDARAAAGSRLYDLCLTDMRLPDGDGIDLVRHMQRHHPDVPVAVITAHGSMDLAIEALKAGAFDFVSKPLDLQVLRDLVNTALKLGTRPDTGGPTLIGASAVMERTRVTVAKLARSHAPVFVSGESGTGKELVARMIHEQGPRADGPFVPVNCGAIPQELMESEVFGHKKGSFTGAVNDKLGLFQAAHGGTLFLDEVADLPLHMQVKLLRAIQEKAVRPVGSEHEVRVDARVLSASHRDLEALVESGEFRQDLYYRLNVINLHVPALRERPGDVAELSDHILARLAEPLAIPTRPLSRRASSTTPVARRAGSALSSSRSLCSVTISNSWSSPVPTVAETSTQMTSPPNSSGTRSCSSSRLARAAAGSAPGRSHLLTATTIGTPAALE